MDPLWGQFAWVLVTAAMFALRAPFIRASTTVPVAHDAVGRREVTLVALVMVGMILLPLVWLLTPLLALADWPRPPWAFALGVAVALGGLWLLRRAHVDLGRNWSNTLQVREGHALVTQGVYRRVRHPMYGALLLHALGQALFLPNAIAGPAYLLAFATLVAGRMGPEERLMRETFGREWDEYAARTWRLLPGLW